VSARELTCRGEGSCKGGRERGKLQGGKGEREAARGEGREGRTLASKEEEAASKEEKENKIKRSWK
jgi:hypothetical protein